MTSTAKGITVLNVRHASRVAAISTAAGPTRLLDAGLADRLGSGGLPVEVLDVTPPADGSTGAIGTSFAVAGRVAASVGDALARSHLAVVLSGSCHTALGTVSGIPDDPRGVVWLDAHPDFNTPGTTESGLLDGTTLAALTGRCWQRLSARVEGFRPVDDGAVVLIGARSVDAAEADLLDAAEIERIPTEDVGERAARVLDALSHRVEGVYVHVDLDVLDPAVGRANAYAVEGGLSTRQLCSTVAEALERCPVRALAFTSYDPSADGDGGACEAALQVAGTLADHLADAQ